MKVLLANPGVQHAFHLAGQLCRQDALSSFHTSFALGEGAWLKMAPVGWMPPVLRKALHNRTACGVPAHLVRSHPLLEIRALLRRRTGWSDAAAFRERNIAFQRAIPESDIRRCNVLVGTDTAGEILAARAAAVDRPFVLSRSIGEGRAWNAVARRIRTDWPDWCDALDEKTPCDLRSEDREHELARIIVVPSHFVARTLGAAGIPSDKIRINPFGCPAGGAGTPPIPPAPLAFLFAGSISARKGVPVLLDAWRRLAAREAELWIAGPGNPPRAALDGLNGVRWLGALSREKLGELYGKAHVFVFPSLFEGFAKVLGEAASAGLPLIATPASGAEEIVQDGENGFLIPEGNVDALVDRMRWCLENSGRLAAMGCAARAAAERLTWNAYGDRWMGILGEVV